MKQVADPITPVDSLKDRLKDARLAAGYSTQEALAEACGVSAGTIGNLESGARKNPRELVTIAARLGVNPMWLLHGKGPREAVTPLTGGMNLHAQPLPMSLGTARLPPPVVQWGELMAAEPMPEFETQLPDDAMAPEAPKGTRVMFVTGVEPEPGNWVLIRDRTGRYYCRVFKQLRPGQWEAHARNPGFLPMDCERDGLTIVAVFDGIRGRRSPN